MDEPLTVDAAVAERDNILKQLNDVVPQLQLRLSYLNGWLDSQKSSIATSDSSQKKPAIKSGPTKK